MNLVSLATGRWGPSLAILICRLLPCKLLYSIAGRLASYLAHRREIPMVCDLHRNMAVVLKCSETSPEVRQAVIRLLRNTLCSYVDLFQAVSSGPDKIAAACGFPPSTVETVSESLANSQGLLLVGAHMCSFDLFLLGLKNLIPSAQVLSNANPQGSSRVMNKIRTQHGLEITPISMQSLRRAVEKLRGGGVVVIAADLTAASGEELSFFGRKSHFLVGHARLAQKTRAEIVACAPHRLGEGRYQVQTTAVPQPASTGNKKQDMLRWAQDSLTAVEAFISRWPDEWLMPTPVCPSQQRGMELLQD